MQNEKGAVVTPRRNLNYDVQISTQRARTLHDDHAAISTWLAYQPRTDNTRTLAFLLALALDELGVDRPGQRVRAAILAMRALRRGVPA